MPVSVSWYDDAKTIVWYDFQGKWTWDELYPEFERALEMERSVGHRVDVILDFRDTHSVGANALAHLKRIADRQPDNIGLSVFVTQNQFMKKLYDIGTSFYKPIGHYFRVVPTVDDALAVIYKEREEAQG